ncbi:MAG: Spy/CpxP family protein refolding chaperone [bacterium]|nr:Spy/CpxP family protein refolding chaperone [bacterium]
MNNKFIWLSASVLALMISQSTQACDTNKDESKSCHCIHSMKKISESLDLSTEQKVKIKTIRLKNRQQFKTNFQQLKALKQQIKLMSSAKKIDEPKLDALILEKNKVHGMLIKNRVLMENEIYNVLTEKQKAKYLILKQKLKHA